MKTNLLPLVSFLAAATCFAADSSPCPGTCAGEKSADAACCQDKPAAACCSAAAAAVTPLAADSIKRYPLKGVITSVLADRSALLVKHEEIPGYMKAMTMLFKVDAATLKAAQKGQAITGLMSRQGSDWVLEDVKFVGGK
jgi:Cu/Ag efflux protein CusF